MGIQSILSPAIATRQSVTHDGNGQAKTTDPKVSKAARDSYNQAKYSLQTLFGGGKASKPATPPARTVDTHKCNLT